MARIHSLNVNISVVFYESLIEKPSFNYLVYDGFSSLLVPIIRSVAKKRVIH